MTMEQSQKEVYQVYRELLESNELKTVSDILAQQSSKDKKTTDRNAQDAESNVNMTEANKESNQKNANAADTDTPMVEAGSGSDNDDNEDAYESMDEVTSDEDERKTNSRIKKKNRQNFAPPPMTMTLRFE